MGMAIGNGAGVGEDASIADVEEVIIGETGELSGDIVEITGFELHATLASDATNRITRYLRNIDHLIKRDVHSSS